MACLIGNQNLHCTGNLWQLFVEFYFQMTCILQMTFSMQFLEWKCLYFDAQFYWNWFLRFQFPIFHLWSRWWLTARWQHTITWPNTDQYLWCYIRADSRPWGGTRPENWWGCAAGRWKLDPKRSRKKLNLGPKRSIFVKIGSFCTPKDSFAVGGWEKYPKKIVLDPAKVKKGGQNRGTYVSPIT